MILENSYIHKKEVDWSLLNQGLTIPVALQIRFKTIIKEILPRGSSIDIQILLDGQTFKAKLVNQNFDVNKYPTHKDLVQIRYEPNSLIAKKMREIFKASFSYFTEFKKNDVLQEYKKRPIPIPDEKKEYLLLYTTTNENTFSAEYITQSENYFIINELSDFNEEEFELSINYSRQDHTARVEERQKLVKIRKLDKSICDNLKELYKYQCQITGENFCERHGVSVVEAHHIDYFTKSLNNNSDNILVVSPNYHRLIHRLNPVFDRKNLVFTFPNGLEEKVKTNYHL